MTLLEQYLPIFSSVVIFGGVTTLFSYMIASWKSGKSKNQIELIKTLAEENKYLKEKVNYIEKKYKDLHDDQQRQLNNQAETVSRLYEKVEIHYNTYDQRQITIPPTKTTTTAPIDPSQFTYPDLIPQIEEDTRKLRERRLDNGKPKVGGSVTIAEIKNRN